MVGAVISAYARYVQPARPGIVYPKGFYGYSDQGFYLETAQILSHFHLPVGPLQYHFGLGYPAAAVPFILLGFKGDPFAPVDVCAFSATVALTFVLATRLRIVGSATQRVLFGVAVAGVAAVGTPLLDLSSIPWNSNIDVALGVLILVIVTSRAPIGRAGAVALGGAVGWIFACRFIDASFLGAPILVAFVLRSPRERRRILFFGTATLIVIVGVVLFTQQHAFGSWLATPYQFHTQQSTGSDDQSVHQYRASWIPEHFTGTFLTGSSHGKREPRDPLLRQFPLLAMAPIGAVVVGRMKNRNRRIWIAAAVMSVVATLVYLSFIAARVTDLKYGNLRYWAAWYPLWSLFAVAAIVRAAVLISQRAGAEVPQ